MRIEPFALFASSFLLASHGAWAQNGTITFNGAVTHDTCVVEPRGGEADGMDLTVRLPSIAQRQLASAGRRGTRIPFHLIVGSGEHPCRQANVRGLFRSVGDNNPAGRLSNRGNAGNVDIVVTNLQGQDVDLNTGENSTVVPVDEKGIAVLSWNASYYAIAPATPGKVLARVQYTLLYP